MANMAKPTLFWTLRPHWWSGGFEIMRVTTEKPRRYHGTDADGEPTQAAVKDCKGRFETKEAAEAVIKAVSKVKQQHADGIATLTAARTLAEKAERDEIDIVLAGGKATPPRDPLEITRAAMAKGPDRCRQIARMS